MSFRQFFLYRKLLGTSRVNETKCRNISNYFTIFSITLRPSILIFAIIIILFFLSILGMRVIESNFKFRTLTKHTFEQCTAIGVYNIMVTSGNFCVGIYENLVRDNLSRINSECFSF